MRISRSGTASRRPGLFGAISLETHGQMAHGRRLIDRCDGKGAIQQTGGNICGEHCERQFARDIFARFGSIIERPLLLFLSDVDSIVCQGPAFTSNYQTQEEFHKYIKTNQSAERLKVDQKTQELSVSRCMVEFFCSRQCFLLIQYHLHPRIKLAERLLHSVRWKSTTTKHSRYNTSDVRKRGKQYIFGYSMFFLSFILLERHTKTVCFTRRFLYFLTHTKSREIS